MKNVVQLITVISVVGISITTAALVILLAAFNGIEEMVEKLYSEFDANLTIRSVSGKTFPEKTLRIDQISLLPEVKQVSRGIEEIVILKHERNWVNAQIYGVDDSFLKLIDAENHLVDGQALLAKNGVQTGIIGASLLDKLGGYVSNRRDAESIIVYSPRRTAKINTFKSPFRTAAIPLTGRINFNREVNEEALIVPFDFASELLEYDREMSVVYVNIRDRNQLDEVKQKIKNLVGNNFEVKTQYEKNALIYQTSRTEKIIVVGILVFIFILAIFNLVASLTMLYIEKKDNLITLNSFGADHGFVFRIFFYEGLLISLSGIFFGLLLGLIIVGIQHYMGVLILPNSGGKAFPMHLTWMNGFMILGIVSVISMAASYFTIYFLLKIQKTA